MKVVVLLAPIKYLWNWVLPGFFVEWYSYGYREQFLLSCRKKMLRIFFIDINITFTSNLFLHFKLIAEVHGSDRWVTSLWRLETYQIHSTLAMLVIPSSVSSGWPWHQHVISFQDGVGGHLESYKFLQAKFSATKLEFFYISLWALMNKKAW